MFAPSASTTGSVLLIVNRAATVTAARTAASEMVGVTPAVCRRPTRARARAVLRGRLCHRLGAGPVGQRWLGLPAGADLELGTNLGQVPFDRPRGQEQLGADLLVGQALPGQPRDLGLLRGELVARAGGALADRLPGGQQLAAGPLGERLHADRVEHLVRGAKLRPRVGPPALATQPLTVEQVRAGELRRKAGTAQPADRLAIAALGVLAVAEQRPAARVGPLPPVGLANAGGLSQPGERAGGQLGLPGPAGRLDQLGQRSYGDKQLRRLLGGLLGLGQGLLVAAETVVQDGRYPLRPLEPHALARGPGVRDDGLDQRGGLGFCPPHTGQEYGCVAGEAAPCRGRDRLRLRDQRSSRRKITAPDLIYR